MGGGVEQAMAARNLPRIMGGSTADAIGRLAVGQTVTQQLTPIIRKVQIAGRYLVNSVRQQPMLWAVGPLLGALLVGLHVTGIHQLGGGAGLGHGAGGMVLGAGSSGPGLGSGGRSLAGTLRQGTIRQVTADARDGNAPMKLAIDSEVLYVLKLADQHGLRICFAGGTARRMAFG